MKRILAVTFVLLNLQLVAQTYSRADSLRGCLTPLRSSVDVIRYDLQVTFNIDSQTISGYNDITFITSGISKQVQFDLFENMKIDGIEMNFFRLNHQREGNAFFVDMPGQPEKGKQYTMRVYYSGKPLQAKRAPWDGGFVWSKTESGEPWIGVACEGLGASVWYPCKDHLSDEPDSGMTISLIVPDSLHAISNGRLETKSSLNDEGAIIPEGYKLWKWIVTYPINNYNVTFYISDYTHFSGKHVNGKDTLTLDYYVLPEHLEKAKVQFKQVNKTLQAFEHYFGKYPFYRDGYKLIESSYAGMEHQSAIAYGNKYMPGYWGRHLPGIDFDYIIIHETGHEWWGNNVSMKDVADMWIHEGFCTYSEVLYVEYFHGKEAALKYVNAMKSRVSNDEPIIGDYEVNNEGSGDMYNKGALMIHSLRNWLNNDSLFVTLLKSIQTEFAYQTVETKQIENYMAQITGLNLKPFFNQYLRSAELPQLQYYFEGKSNLFYRWKAAKGFQMPVTVSTKKDKMEQVTPTEKWQRISVKLKPSQFKVDESRGYFSVKQVGSEEEAQ